MIRQIGIFFRLLMFSLLCMMSKTESHRDNLPCAYNFHVWNPGNDIVQKVKDVNYKVENMTGYIDREFLKMKASMFEELKQCQNWTITLERDISEMKFMNIKGRITERDTSSSITDVERDILDLKKKVSHLKNNYHKINKKIHSTNVAAIRNIESFNNDDKHLLIRLKDLVRDLKSEWVVLKRDVVDLQTEHMNMKTGQNVYSNFSFHFSKSLKLLTSKVSALQNRDENFTNSLKLQSDVQNRCFAQIENLKAADDQYTKITTNIKTNMEELEDKIETVNTDFGLLKGDNAYLKKIVLASLKRPNLHRDETEEGEQVLFNGVPKDCQDILEMGYGVSGVYQIKPVGANDLDNVYCEILNETAYTVIQRRTDGLLSFNRQWIEYKFGFGNLYGSHWIGNEWINFLTNQDQYALRIDIWDWEGKKHFAEYDTFLVDNQDLDYKLHIGGYNGNAGDSFSFHDGMKFSTEDMDNDLNVRHCAAENKSGWWFNNCYVSNLNGVFHVGYYSHTQYSDGIVWYTLKEDEKYSLRKVEMKLRRRK